jgi:subfamily B ATP-binding cassette protein MsbA
VREVIVAAGALVMMLVINWRLALVTFALVPFCGVLLHRLGSVIRRWGSLAQSEAGALASTLNEQLHGFTTVKGFRGEPFELARFMATNRRFRKTVMRGELWSVMLLSSVFLVTGGGLLVIVWYGTELLASGSMTRGTVLAFCLYAGQTVEPLRRLSEIQSLLQSALAAGARLYEVIDTPSAEDASDSGIQVTDPLAGAIRFENVTFKYEPHREDVLDRVTFSLEAGERVALVGASGGGKSTLAGLLVRFHEPDSGRILLDGMDLRSLQLSHLRRTISVVQQEPFVFSGSLADNIRYGTPAAPSGVIEEAVRIAGLTEWVAALPQGLDSMLTEEGAQLSGGEKQRISLARTIVSDPSVVLLDEALSGVDGETEVEIFRRLEQWFGRRTVMAISHRFSTVARFPRIIVLHGGRIVADGPLPELVRTSPVFTDLFADQIDAASLGGVRDASGIAPAHREHNAPVRVQQPVENPQPSIMQVEQNRDRRERDERQRQKGAAGALEAIR